MVSSHESRITWGQNRLRLLAGNRREYLLNLHGTRRRRISRKRDRVVGEWIGGPDDLVGVRLHVAPGDHGVAIAIEVCRHVDLASAHCYLVGSMRRPFAVLPECF